MSIPQAAVCCMYSHLITCAMLGMYGLCCVYTSSVGDMPACMSPNVIDLQTPYFVQQHPSTPKLSAEHEKVARFNT